MLRVLTPARSLRLTTPERVASDMGLSASAATQFEDLVDEISSEIESFVGYRLVRERVRETLESRGNRNMFLSRTPVASLEQTTFEDTVVSGVSVANPGTGEVYYRDQFDNTMPLDVWIRPSQGAAPGQPLWAFTYWAGFLTRDDDIVSGTLTAESATQELVLTGDSWPYLVSGDAVAVEGFATEANNGRFVVLARVSDTRLRIETALTDETVSGVATVVVRNLPGELERAVLDEAKTRYLSQSRASDITSERIGDWSATYGNGSQVNQATTHGFSNRRTAEKLERWQRVV